MWSRGWGLGVCLSLSLCLSDSPPPPFSLSPPPPPLNRSLSLSLTPRLLSLSVERAHTANLYKVVRTESGLRPQKRQWSRGFGCGPGVGGLGHLLAAAETTERNCWQHQPGSNLRFGMQATCVLSQRRPGWQYKPSFRDHRTAAIDLDPPLPAIHPNPSRGQSPSWSSVTHPHWSDLASAIIGRRPSRTLGHINERHRRLESTPTSRAIKHQGFLRARRRAQGGVHSRPTRLCT